MKIPLIHGSVVFSENPNIFYFIVMLNREIQQIITLKSVESGVLGMFSLKRYFDDCLIMKMAAPGVILLSNILFIN